MLEKARGQLDIRLSKSVSRFLSAIFNVLIVIFAVAIIITELGYDITAIVAGLGIGGLTIALAAKDSAANFFGGLILITEQPFEIGDSITCGTIEGTVEDIDLRTTKVRNASGLLTIVPNSTLSGEPITNWTGAMEYRQANFKLSLQYDTSEAKMRQFLEGIRTMLETDPEIEKKSILVRFSDFSDSSIDVRIRFNTALPSYADHMRIRERVNFGLMQLAEKNEVDFAFPTRSIYVQNPK